MGCERLLVYSSTTFGGRRGEMAASVWAAATRARGPALTGVSSRGGGLGSVRAALHGAPRRRGSNIVSLWGRGVSRLLSGRGSAVYRGRRGQPPAVQGKGGEWKRSGWAARRRSHRRRGTNRFSLEGGGGQKPVLREERREQGAAGQPYAVPHAARGPTTIRGGGRRGQQPVVGGRGWTGSGWAGTRRAPRTQRDKNALFDTVGQPSSAGRDTQVVCPIVNLLGRTHSCGG